MIRRIYSKMVSSHTRNIDVISHVNEVVYHIPLWGERRDLGPLTRVIIEEHKIRLEFERDNAQITPVKKDEEIILPLK